MQKIILTLSLLLIIPFIACNKKQTEEKPAKKHTVEWPQLSQLDHIMHEAADHANNNDFEKLKPALNQAAQLIIKMKKDGQPLDTRSPVKVEGTLDDLANAALEITAIEQTDESLKTNFNTIHELTEKLMQQSGVGHTH